MDGDAEGGGSQAARFSLPSPSDVYFCLSAGERFAAAGKPGETDCLAA